VMLGARFQVKIANLQNEGFRILAQNMWKIMQIYITKATPIRIAGMNNAQSWGTYNPGLFLGDYDVQIKLGSTAETIKETARQQAMQYFLMASKLPFIDQQKLFVKTSVQLFDMSNRDAQSLVMPPQPQQQPTIVPKLIESIQFQQLYPDEQAELLAEAGVQPSPLREAQTNTPASPVNPSKVALNASIVHNPNPVGPATQDYSNAGQMAATGAQVPEAVGAANVPGAPNA